MTDDKLKTLLQGMGGKLLRDDTLTEKKRVASTGSSAASESSSVVINKNPTPVPSTESSAKPEQPLRIRTKNLEIDGNEEDDDFNDYVIESPLPPPRDLQPGKLYALYEFSGDDPSHCELDRDDAVVLLNDQDSYWWLVRKDIDGKIGFAPAECLETYHERLARLNCWKNEELERNSKENLEQFPAKTKAIREMFGDSDIDESPLIQPTAAFFTNQNNSGSIGTYSPSSSEFDSPGNTPPLDQYKRKPPQAYDGFRGSPAGLEYEKKGNIPQSKGTRDIVNSMKMLDDLINDELNTTATLDEDEDTDQAEASDEERDITLTCDSGDDDDIDDGEGSGKTGLKSPIVLEEPHRTNLSNITNSTYTNSNTSLQRTSTSTSVDLEYDEYCGCEKGQLHPEIVSIFQGSLSKIDELELRLKELSSQFA
ncbi:Bud site selection protein 14 [Cyberlindnera fabianii]|uniref:Bud site selection protein 14 n=1 Tax=Cyberlindnera fabianii TaxID=36022 RepID=A0A1V2LA92_CYBFA|nr:Bud site selection protein 14 [Cyberlindnera fabianii]